MSRSYPKKRSHTLRLISHRGNLNGPSRSTENSPKQIDVCIDLGYDVEIDIRFCGDRFYLGHDFAENPVDRRWLENRADRLWVHCKDACSLDLLSNSYLNCFWHDKDDYTVTTCGYVWAYPGKRIISNCVLCLPENVKPVDDSTWDWKNNASFAVCSDFIQKIKEAIVR